MISEEDVKNIMKSCKQKANLVAHQIDSYDHFVYKVMPAIVKENSVLVINYPKVNDDDDQIRLEINFGDIHFDQPSNKESNGMLKYISPIEARTRTLTYASPVYVDIVQTLLKMPKNMKELPILIEKKLYKRKLLCMLPVMIGSCLCYLRKNNNTIEECPFDDGGYFIVNGMEKAIVSQEKLATNLSYVFPVKKGVSPLPASYGKSVLLCEVRSSHEKKLRSTSTLNMHLMASKNGKTPEFWVILQYLECPVKLSWLFILLGWNGNGNQLENLILTNKNKTHPSLKKIVKAICDKMQMEASLIGIDDIKKHIGEKGTYENDFEKRERYIRYILSSETLPHMGIDESQSTKDGKIAYLCNMVSKILAVRLNIIPCDDRDHYANKRIDTAGSLVAHLFRLLYRSFIKTLQSQVQKAVNKGKYVDLIDSRMINHKRISSGFRNAFGTGNWGIPKVAGGAGSATGQVGITQQLSRMSGMSATAHVRRITTPLHKEGRNPKPRQLNCGSWGVICSTETPEGISCGLVKNLAWDTRVRISTPTSMIYTPIKNTRDGNNNLLIIPLQEIDEKQTYTMVTINGVIIGYTKSPKLLREKLRIKRQYQEIPFDTTIAYMKNAEYQNVFRIHTDNGCLLRPILDVSNLYKAKEILDRFSNADYALDDLWTNLLENGIIEYVDKDEESTLRVAETLNDLLHNSVQYKRSVEENQAFTHCEIHPSVIHGVCASLIPFPNHNQSPRNTYQSAMGKQALGIPASNFRQRLDAIMHVLMSPEKPLVATWMEDMTVSKKMPAGQNVMVAIMCHSGFNQEDSLIMNKSSVDAGMFYSMVYKTSKDETRPDGTDNEKLEIPDESKCVRLKAGTYDHLAESGVAKIGSTLKKGDIVIGKTVETTDLVPDHLGGGKIKTKRDKSTQIKASEEGEVDRVIVTSNHENNKTVKVRTRQLRIPQIGDKFSSRHGQKGIVGMMRHRKDMPFDENGLTPDLIVNPHAIPSRMTIGHLFETLLGFECTVNGKYGDGTPFRMLSVEQIAQKLEKHGYNKYCDTKLRCGLTGKLLEAKIYFGPTYYQRLKHMVNDKTHARSRGPITPLTRQPVEGRSRDGGLRIGEMERDAMLSHGCSAVVRDRMFESSDPNISSICTNCHLLCSSNNNSHSNNNNNDTTNLGYCHNCNSSDHVCNVPIPFAAKLTLQEILSTHIAPRIYTASEENDDEKNTITQKKV